MPKQPGWFSRRHKTSDAYNEWREKRDGRVVDWELTMAENEAARSKRTNAQQIALLDERLGKNKGAVKERARLAKRAK